MMKRTFDVLLATLGLVLLSPLLALGAILIKLDSPGPIIFAQTRVGRGFRVFTLLKFRTMVRDAHESVGRSRLAPILALRELGVCFEDRNWMSFHSFSTFLRAI